MHDNRTSATTTAATPADPITPVYAKALLGSARAAGLVHPDDSFAEPLRAKLADVGVQSLGQLDGDQVDDVADFITSALAAFLARHPHEPAAA